ncbi:MAG: Gx transporter family protein [Bacillota bacterium]|nr:Gx transporter family protein [Bacillota bacterium]
MKKIGMVTARKIAVLSVLTALSLALSLLEQMLPLALIVPVPGIRLGLSNIVVMFALFYFGASPAFLVLVSRIFLLLLLSGNVSSFFLSLCGGLSALSAMNFLKKWHGSVFSLFGVSVGGACAHNFGQLAGAFILLSSDAVFLYLPALLFAGAATGLLTAYITSLLFKPLERSNILSGLRRDFPDKR